LIAFSTKSLEVRGFLKDQENEAVIKFMENDKIPWPHAPTHCLQLGGTFFVTAATLYKEHYFRGAERLRFLQHALLEVARKHQWRLEAWAVFSNHYHFVGHSPVGEDDARTLGLMLAELHRSTARMVNQQEQNSERQIWYNFWETRLSFRSSYLARLKYVHQNPVKHGLVPNAALYPWCSARWFEREVSRAMVNAIYRFKIDALSLKDHYDPCSDW
jgi:putative transposase